MERAPNDPVSALVNQFMALPSDIRLQKAFTFVRDIPYGQIGSRDPYDVLAKLKGTCSGKHALLKLVFEGLGYQAKPFLARHDLSKLPIDPWPPPLMPFRADRIEDYHNFLKVKLRNKWITVDCVFDKPLENLGFSVADWDGASNMPVAVNVEKVISVSNDIESRKTLLLNHLSSVARQRREEFFRTLTSWLDEERRLGLD
jgi:hypothetical protein